MVIRANLQRYALLAAVAFAVPACHGLHVTQYASGRDGSFNILFGRRPVALANFAQRENGVALILFATDMDPGTHAVHMHTSCRNGGNALPEGRLGNIEVDPSRVGKFETLIKGAMLDDLMGQTLVIHEGKDYHYSSPEMSVGGVLGCGVFELQSKVVSI